jgi:N-acetylmuramoyl-L-alanine amidase
LGRFFSVDPLISKYPHYSSYSFSGNKVIGAVELEGLEEWSVNSPDGSVTTIAGPYADQSAAQEAYSASLVDVNGWVQSDRITLQPETELEHGNLTSTNALILHRTDSYTAQSSLSNFANGIGTHFLVGEDGSIYQTASIKKRTYHVGKIKSKCYQSDSCSDAETKKIKAYGWSPENVHDNEVEKSYPTRFPYNSDAIGIEVVGKYNSVTKSWTPLTNEQIESTAYLVNVLKMNLNLSFADVYTHEEISYKTAGEGQVVLDAIRQYIQDLE